MSLPAACLFQRRLGDQSLESLYTSEVALPHLDSVPTPVDKSKCKAVVLSCPGL